MNTPELIAFLLPQFHAIAENDAWWGKGFTEWTNVRKAQPQFRTHRQPRVPVAGRYYNLLDPQTRIWQAELARRHGIGGFCYYHYWFNGRLLLEQPLERVLKSGQPDFPFCMAWANEPWTRRWDGGDSEVLMAQDYGERDDWMRHFDYLAPFLRDPRYLRCGDRPLILIYRTASITRCADMLDCWRARARAQGIGDLYIVSMLTYFERDERADLFDAYVDFEPMASIDRLPWHRLKWEQIVQRCNRLQALLPGGATRARKSRSYSLLWRTMCERPSDARHWPGAFVDWDNSPRRPKGESLVLRNVSIDTFEAGLASQMAKATRAGAPYVFINAWNEWAEGAYLEPDEDYGLAWLEAISRVLTACRTAAAARS